MTACDLEYTSLCSLKELCGCWLIYPYASTVCRTSTLWDDGHVCIYSLRLLGECMHEIVLHISAMKCNCSKWNDSNNNNLQALISNEEFDDTVETITE